MGRAKRGRMGLAMPLVTPLYVCLGVSVSGCIPSGAMQRDQSRQRRKVNNTPGDGGQDACRHKRPV